MKMASMTAESRLFDEHLQQLLKNAAQRMKLAEGEDGPVVEQASYENLTNQYNPEQRLVSQPYVTVKNGVAHSAAHAQLPSSVGTSNSIIRHVEDPVLLKQKKQKSKKATAGDDWYSLPRTILTPEAKREFQLLQMRNVLDTHRHYRRSDNAGKFPEYSQPGTIVEGATEFYSSRIQKRDRKETLAEEILATETSNRKFKTKYTEIQDKKTSGRKAHYKKKMSKRRRLPTG